MRRRHPFQVKYKGRDLWTWPVESSHVVYSQEMHWRLAAKWNGMTFEKFSRLEGEEQSKLVATYETSMQMEAVMTADARRQTNRKQPRRSHGN